MGRPARQRRPDLGSGVRPGALATCWPSSSLAAAETVVDIPATLASRVGLLGAGRSDKNDANDARSVAVAALRAPAWCRSGSRTTPPCCGCCRAATPSWRGRRTRPPVGFMPWSLTWCRAGSTQKSWSPRPRSCSRTSRPAGCATVERLRLALELVDDLDRLETQRKASTACIRTAVAASGTHRSQTSSGSVMWSPPP